MEPFQKREHDLIKLYDINVYILMKNKKNETNNLNKIQIKQSSVKWRIIKYDLIFIQLQLFIINI